jgi:hypothetical protein
LFCAGLPVGYLCQSFIKTRGAIITAISMSAIIIVSGIYVLPQAVFGL